jgi:hypothetical protein
MGIIVAPILGPTLGAGSPTTIRGAGFSTSTCLPASWRSCWPNARAARKTVSSTSTPVIRFIVLSPYVLSIFIFS